MVTICVSFLLATPLLADGIDYSFAATPGEELKVTAKGGASIRVETSSSSNVSINISRRNDSESRILSDYDIEAYRDGGAIVVEIERKSWLSGFLGIFNRGLAITVEIPHRFDVDLSTSGGSIRIADLEGRVHARTSGGSLRFESIDGSIDAHTSGGSINIEACSGETKVTTSGGSIKIERADGTVTAHTSGGSIRVHEVRGTINASTSGGSVEAYIREQPTADSSLTTSGGTVKVVLGNDVAVDLSARTSGGRVYNDFEILIAAGGSTSKNRLEGAINGGGPELKLRTSGGSIHVRRR